MTVTEANTLLSEADLLVGESEVSAAIVRMADEILSSCRTPIPCCCAS